MNLDSPNSIDNSNLSIKRILMTWLPLVGSWLMMSIENPAINAVIARLPNAEVNMAAYGGVVFSLAILIGSPTIMLLAASTALSRDWQSYRKLQKYTLILGGSLSLLHLIISVTPLYDFIVTVLLGVPAEVVEPGRIGLICLAPWSLCIAYRRFQQGAMIRFEHSRMVGEVTIVRLVTVGTVLVIGLMIKTIPGTLLGGMAMGLGIAFEAIYAGIRVRKIRPEIKAAPKVENELTFKRFIRFYIPLALTSMMTVLWQPLISAAVSRMPDPIESMAIWSVVAGLLHVFRSVGMAYNEVVVALINKRRSYPALRKFARIASISITIIITLFVVTPISRFWFSKVANLTADMVVIARIAFAIGIPYGFLSIYLSLFQGIVVNYERTGVVAEAVIAFLLSLTLVLVIGVLTEAYKGIYLASMASIFALLMQVIWLMWRSRKQCRMLAVIE